MPQSPPRPADPPASTTLDRSLRVLLVEDSLTLRNLIGKTLETMRHEVTTADNGRDAVKAVAVAEAAGRPFDVVLMDVVMPELNGVEATHEIRKRGYVGKVMILTAADAMFDMAASLCAGADDYLAKPFGPPELKEALERNFASLSGGGG